MSRLYPWLRACAAALIVAGSAQAAQAATILVTTSADELNTDGDCSLREAVQAANTNAAVDLCGAGTATGDVVVLTAISGQTVNLTLGQIEITDGVAIGAVGTNVTVDANDTGRIFRIDVAGTTEPVVLTGLTLRDGNGFIGGAVLVADGEATTFLNVTFDSNTSAASGGALRVGTGTNTITGCTFTANSVTVAGITDGGGAVYNNGGQLNVNQSTFSGNTATTGTANGGAILNGFGGTLGVGVGTTFLGNTAARAGGAIESAGNLTVDGGSFTSNLTGINGGAVHLTGAVTAVFTGTTTFALNTAGMEGGAVWNSATGTLTMTNSQITDNTAAGPAADQGGGGVFSDGGITNLTNLTITGNDATGAAGSGGGVLNTVGGRLTITGGTISNNTSVRAGGGVENAAAVGVTGNMAMLNNVTITGNNAGTAPGFGGGVHVTGIARVTVTGGTIDGNTAVEGGGLWKAAPGTLTIDGTAITNNQATGALATQGGGGVFSDGGTGLTISNATINGNDATGTAGSGGGVFNDIGATTTVTNTTINDNTAQRAGAGVEDNSGARLTLTNVTISGNITGVVPGNGGGLHITGTGTVVMNGGSVSNNRAVEGGGLWKSAAGTLTATGTAITNNLAVGAAADQGGGGVYNDGAGGVLTLSNMVISDNDATGAAGSGGGLLNNVGGTAVLTNVTFRANTAVRAGGGIEDNSGELVTVRRSTFETNTTGAAPGNGGAVHITGTGVVTVDSSRVVGNTAVNQGGGLWTSGMGQMTVRYTTVSNNSAAVGGGVYQLAGLKGLTVVEHSLVSANTATTTGGGFAANGAAVVIENSTVSGNSAPTGGGLTSGGARYLMSNATVASNTATTAGGGLFRTATATRDSLFSLDNTIVADNAAPTSPDLSGVVMSRGYNLFETTTGATVVMDEPAGPDLVGVDPLLQPLADNGGPTFTHALTAGSPAIGAGMTSLLLDQRGYTRMPNSSIGAFEFGGMPVAGEDGPVAGNAPAAFELSAAAPNPFRSETTLRFTTATAEPVEVALYDALGRRVRTLYAGTPGAATSVEVRISGADLAPGVYVVRLTGETAASTQRVTVMR